MLRDHARPHCGWSAARPDEITATKATHPTSTKQGRPVFIGDNPEGNLKEDEGTRILSAGGATCRGGQAKRAAVLQLRKEMIATREVLPAVCW